MAEIHFDITGDNAQVLKSLQDTIKAITNLKNTAADADKNLDFKNGQKSVKELEKATSDASKSINSSLTSMAGRYLSVAAAVTTLTGVLSRIISLNKDFERKNAELAAVLGSTRQEIQGMTEAAENLGRTTEYTSSQVTELQVNLARLGFSENQILNMQESVLKFASAVGADLGRAAAFSGAALRAFGMDATQTTHLLNVMAASTSKSALDFSKLETSMSIVAPVAHSFGISVEDTVTMLGALSNAGFDASTAATALRNILLNLANDSGKLAKGLGHTAKTFPEIMAALKECSDRGIDLNETLQMTDLRSVSAFSALISGADSVNELREALGDCDTALDDMYKTMTENLEGAMRTLASAWEGLLLKFKGVNGPITDAVNGLAKGINYVTDNAEQFGKVLMELVATFGVYKAALITFNVIQATSTALAKGYTLAELAQYKALLLSEKAQALLNKTILKNPYVAAAAAVAALAFGIYKLATASTEAEKAIKKVDNAEKKMTSNMIAERAQIDAMFSRLKAAKEGTEEYNAAKEAIMSKYGNYLSKLGDEKTALNNIAEAYKEVATQAENAARARAIEGATQTAAQDYGDTIADLREKAYELLKKKFGDQKGEDGMSLAETYFWKIVPVIEGEAEIDEELQQIIDSFDEIKSITGGVAATTITYTDNGLKNILAGVNGARAVYQQALDAIRVKLGVAPVNPAETTTETGDGASTTTTTTTPKKKVLTEKEKKEIERAKKELENLKASMYSDSSRAAVAAMKDGYDKELKTINVEEELQLKAIEAAKKKMMETAKKAGKPLSQETLVQFDAWSANVKISAQNKRDALSYTKNDAQNAYLTQYGTYMQKRLAIQEEYQDKIDQATDEWQKKSLEKQRDAELSQLDLPKYEYLREYGTYWDKRLAIQEEYQTKIDQATDEWEKKRLEKEKAARLRELEADKYGYNDILNSGKDFKSKKRSVNTNYDNQQRVLDDRYADLQQEQKQAKEAATTKKNAILEEMELNRKAKEELGDADANQQKALDERYDQLWKEYDEVEELSEAKNKSIEEEMELNRQAHDQIESNRQSEILQLETEYGGALAKVFGDIQKYTSAQIAEAKALAKAYLDAHKNLSPEDVKSIQQQINALDELEFNKQFEWGSTDLTDVFKMQMRINDLQEQYAKRQKEIDDEAAKAGRERTEEEQAELDDISAKMAQSKAQLKKNLIAAGVNGFIQGLNKAVAAMKELAEATGDTQLGDAADSLGAMAQNLQSAGEGAAAGGWIGAIVGGVLDMIMQTAEAFENVKVQEAKAALAAEKWANAIKLADLKVDNKQFETVFGEKSIEKARANYGAMINAQKTYEEEKKRLNDKYNEEKPNQKVDINRVTGYDLFAIGIGSGIWRAAVQDNDSKQWKAYQDAIQKGQKGIQTMLVKTKEATGWEKFWGGEDEFTSLGSLAPEMFDENGEIIIDRAKEFLSVNEQITDEQREQIEELVEIQEAYEEALKVVNEQITNTFGSLASDLTDVIWDSVMSGTGAWANFKQVGSEVIASLGKQLIQEMLISTYLEQFRERMVNAYKLGSNKETQEELRNITADIFAGLEGAVESGMSVAEEWRNWAEKEGFDLSQTAENVSSSGKSFQAISESTGSELNGRMTSMQISMTAMNEAVTQSLVQVTIIAGLVGANNNMLSEIRQLHTLELGYLEDIARQTKPILDFNAKLDTLIKNTQYS